MNLEGSDNSGDLLTKVGNYCMGISRERNY